MMSRLTIPQELPGRRRTGCIAAGVGGYLLVLAGCGGGLDETIATTAESSGDHQLWSGDKPRLDMAPEEEGIWVVQLPLGVEGKDGPVVRIEADERGGLAKERFWIGAAGEGREVGITPYPDYPGYYRAEPMMVEFSTPDRVIRRASIEPLIRAKADGAIQFRYSAAEVRRGYFPAVGREFLIYDGNANGLYEMDDMLVIDQNGDGRFDGNRNSVERYTLDEPFFLGEHPYRIASVEPDGSALRWITSDVPPEPRIPLLTGDRAPDFELADLAGRPIRFSEESAGRPVLLSYWATW